MPKTRIDLRMDTDLLDQIDLAASYGHRTKWIEQACRARLAQDPEVTIPIKRRPDLEVTVGDPPGDNDREPLDDATWLRIEDAAIAAAPKSATGGAILAGAGDPRLVEGRPYGRSCSAEASLPKMCAHAYEMKASMGRKVCTACGALKP